MSRQLCADGNRRDDRDFGLLVLDRGGGMNVALDKFPGNRVNQGWIVHGDPDHAKGFALKQAGYDNVQRGQPPSVARTGSLQTVITKRGADRIDRIGDLVGVERVVDIDPALAASAASSPPGCAVLSIPTALSCHSRRQAA